MDNSRIWRERYEYLGYESECDMWQDLYVDQDIRGRKLADMFDLRQTHTYIRRIKKCGLPVRKPGGARHTKKKLEPEDLCENCGIHSKGSNRKWCSSCHRILSTSVDTSMI
ncbi:MAG: hypothetical protein GY861_11095 [bacterium]|nr:hypothetical protein [bacterium]